MISLQKAIDIVLNSVTPLGSECISIEESLHRVISENIISDINIPPLDMSAMDGFACRAVDRDLPLRVIETIAAGYVPEKEVGPGDCSRIMTGAMVPAGADCVVMFEHVKEYDNTVEVVKKIKNRNIRKKAEQVNAGELILSTGTCITPAVCGVLSTAGKKTVPVSRRPTVGIIATGNELVEPQVVPSNCQIRNSNSSQLFAQVLQCGCLPNYYGIAEDTLDATRELIEIASAQSDVVLISGGVSAGDYDCVPDALKKAGYNLLFEKVAIKPGKPTVFGTNGTKSVFGMPGNPVSTFVLFELLVKPFLFKLMEHTFSPLIIKAPVNSDVLRKNGDRLEIIPVRITNNGMVEKISYHGSAHIHAYTKADGFIAIEEGVECIPNGTEVTVQLLDR